MTYPENQADWAARHRIHVGSTVKVLHPATGYSNDWGAEWVASMNNAVGFSFKVLQLTSPCTDNNWGVQLATNGILGMTNDYWFPFFVLELSSRPAYQMNNRYQGE